MLCLQVLSDYAINELHYHVRFDAIIFFSYYTCCCDANKIKFCFIGAGRLPNVEIRMLGSIRPAQLEVPAQKDQFGRVPYEIASQFEVASLSNARTTLDTAFNLDSANGHMEMSNESEAGFNLYAYGVRIFSIGHFVDVQYF